MEIVQNNSMSDLIYLFLDGEADGTQQDLLFKSLADNPELQSEFIDALSLNKSLVTDSKNLIPSNELTHNLFVKAGFESGVAGSSVSGLVSESARHTFVSGIIGKIKSSFIPASIGSVVTAALLTSGMYILNIDFSDGRAAVSKDGIQKRITQSVNQVPVIKSEEVQSMNNTHQSSYNSGRRYIPVFNENAQNEPVNNVQTITENTNETVENIPVIIIPDIRQSNLVQMNELPELRYRNNNFAELITPPNVGFGDLTIPSNLNILVEVKGINTLGFFDSRKTDDSKVFLKNLAVSGFYKLNDNFYLGISFGNEQLQVYEVSRDSSGLHFLSEPNLFWFGLSMKTMFDKMEFLGNLQPYFDLSVAYSKWGPVGKGAIGMYYNPDNSFTMGLGLESTLLYLIDPLGSDRATGKYSLVYSFGYNF